MAEDFLSSPAFLIFCFPELYLSKSNWPWRVNRLYVGGQAQRSVMDWEATTAMGAREMARADQRGGVGERPLNQGNTFRAEPGGGPHQ